VMSFASSSTPKCFITAGSLIEDGFASSLTEVYCRANLWKAAA
jgi:hypothetical protein